MRKGGGGSEEKRNLSWVWECGSVVWVRVGNGAKRMGEDEGRVKTKRRWSL